MPSRMRNSVHLRSSTTALQPHVSPFLVRSKGRTRGLHRRTKRDVSRNESDQCVFNALGSDALLDSFGCPPYRSPFALNGCASAKEHPAARTSTTTTTVGSGGGGGGDDSNGFRRRKGKHEIAAPSELDVPWQLRQTFSNPVCRCFEFLGTKHFWFLVQLSMRVTLVGLLIPAVIIALQLPKPPFFSSLYTLPAVIMGVGTSFGRSASFIMQFLKAACICLPLSTACRAVSLHRVFGYWLLVYAVVLFLIGSLSENMTRRVGLLLFNISMVGQLLGETELATDSRILVDWLIGVFFALAATLLPYPLLSTCSARSTIRHLFSNFATVFRGISMCFWSNSNTERSVGMVRIRHITHSIDVLLAQIEEVEDFTFYEFLFFDSYERREVRLKKIELMNKLRLNLRSLTRVIGIVQDSPHIIDDSDRCIQFGANLSRHMEGISRAVEELLDGIASAQERKNLLELGPLFEVCGQKFKRLQDEFSHASRVLFYEKDSEEMEEFVPLMTFFVFSVVSFWSALDDFYGKIRSEQTKPTSSALSYVWKGMVAPFVGNAIFLRRVFLKRSAAELQVVIEAAKVSVAMLIAVLFFHYARPHSMLLSGPTIIAFVSGMNPVEAVQASVARFTGTLLGSVIGFFAASLSTTNVESILSLCIITAALTFFRTGQKYGTVCMYANFIAVSSLSLDEDPTAEMVISRIQQNSFAIMVYCLICVAVFPVSPGALLMSNRIKLLQFTRSIVGNMVQFYDEPIKSDVVRQDGPQWSSQEGNWVSTFGNTSDDRNHMNSPIPLLPTFIAVPESDPRICALFDDVDQMQKVLRVATNIMPFAAEERGLAPTVYPQVACQALQTSLYRVFALVYTMACGWKLMCDKGYFTVEMRRILRYLQPIASDISVSLHRFVNVLSFYVTHPSSSLAPEVTKSLMQFRALVEEFGYRKNNAILEVISGVVMRERRKLQHLSSGNCGQSDCGGDNIPTSTTCDAVHGAMDGHQGAHQLSHAVEGSPPPQSSGAVAERKVQSKTVREEGAETETQVDDTEDIPQTHPTTPPPGTTQPTENVPYGGDGGRHTSGGYHHHHRHQSRQEAAGVVSRKPSTSSMLFSRTVEKLHYDTPSETCSSEAAVHFSDSFTAPITVHDAEGLHTIALALDMLGKELRNVLLSFEEMIGRRDR